MLRQDMLCMGCDELNNLILISKVDLLLGRMHIYVNAMRLDVQAHVYPWTPPSREYLGVHAL